MKVAVDLSILDLDSAGSAVYARELVDHLNGLRSSCRVIPLSCRNPFRHRYGKVLFHDLFWIPFLLSRAAARAGANLLHCPAYKVPFSTRMPVVVTFHDLSPIDLAETYGPWSRLYGKLNLLALSSRARFILTDSQFSKSRLTARLGFPSERIFVVPLGLRQIFLDAQGQNATSQLTEKLGRDRPYILYVGTVERRKNVSRLVQCFHRLRTRAGIPHRLVLAGKGGRGFEDVKNLVAMLGLEDVHFLGKVPDEELPSLYAGADLFAYLSVYEGFGLPPLEAMSQGAVTVVSNRSSLPEVVGDGALLVDPEDDEEIYRTIHRALTDESLRRSLSTRARRRARRFTWGRTAKLTLNAYEKAVGKQT